MSASFQSIKNNISSALIGASKVSQLEENVAALNNVEFTDEEFGKIVEDLK